MKATVDPLCFDTDQSLLDVVDRRQGIGTPYQIDRMIAVSFIPVRFPRSNNLMIGRFKAPTPLKSRTVFLEVHLLGSSY